MSGLIGSVNYQGKVQSLSLAPLRHRGPDAEGHWFSSDCCCWLGHTRLATQGFPSEGVQPVTSHCGRFTLVFDGKFFNHLQIRQGLRFQAWRGQSDSETLVEGLAQRGPSILLELRGMFSFAAYDCQKEQLLLARDRLGIKPLYLRWQSQGLFFASERRAFLCEENLAAQTFSQVLAFGHDFTPVDFPDPELQGIISLPAGVVVRINHNRPHDPVRYWPPQPRPNWSPLPVHSLNSAHTFLREQLQEVVDQHLQGDVPMACFLTSGLKSGILAALACRQKQVQISTFTVVLPGSPPDESSHTRWMARHCGSDHHELVVNEENALDWVQQALLVLDGPTSGCINTFLISRAVANQGIKVALSGLGADELFGGYPSHRLLPWLQLLSHLPEGIRQRLLRRFSPLLAGKLSGLPHWDHWHLDLALRRFASDDVIDAAGAQPLQWPKSPSQRITQSWGQISWAELFGYTEPMLLRDADVMSMACGLELRVPFLDHLLVEIALRMPQRFQKPDKSLLRQACADLFPPGYLNRPKQDSVLPMSVWMRGPLKELSLARLEALQQSGWLDSAWIAQQWQAFEAGQLHWSRAWRLVVLGEFALRQ